MAWCLVGLYKIQFLNSKNVFINKVVICDYTWISYSLCLMQLG